MPQQAIFTFTFLVFSYVCTLWHIWLVPKSQSLGMELTLYLDLLDPTINAKFLCNLELA
jgi:hypothetical protein